MLKTIIPAAILALTTTLAAPAVAGPIDVNSVHGSIFGDENGANKWRVVTKFSVDGNESGNVYAGAFRLNTAANGTLSDFLAFCLEPLSPLDLSKDYAVGSLFAQTMTDNLNTLAANAWDLVQDSTSAGAFQLAAWEITTETAANFDLDSGFFQVTSDRSDSNAAEALANTWLTNLNDDTWAYDGEDYLIINAAGTQDLLTNVAAVPLPATGMMLLGGLLGAGALSRRKSRKA